MPHSILQDKFLEHVRDTGVPVSVWLVTGIRFSGRLMTYDDFSLLLMDPERRPTLVYKHAVRSVVPDQPIQLWEGAEGEGRPARPPARGPRPPAGGGPAPIRRRPPDEPPVVVVMKKRPRFTP
jgi:host factor-I protein